MVVESQDEAAGTPEQGPNEKQAEQQSPLTVTVQHFHYDAKCKLLSVKIHFENSGRIPIFLLAEDFCFVTQDPGLNWHFLGVEQDADTLTFDLSFLMPTADDLASVRSQGTLGTLTPVIEIPPEDFRYTTYAFQFPLVLTSPAPPTRTVHAPKRQTTIRLRFGYGYERLTAFSDRQFSQDPVYPKDSIHSSMTAETWHQRVISDWQHIALTEPITVHFQ